VEDRPIEMESAMRKLMVAVAAFAFGACNATPPAATVTEQLAGLRVTHPTAWTAVAGPGPVAGGGLVPRFYLTNTALKVACSAPPSGGLFEGCPAPVETLPPGGVLVTVSDAGNLNEPLPPEVTAGAPTDDWPGPCRSIGGERQVSSVLDGVIVSACLRGPNLDASEAAVRAMIASLTAAG
jgi:hypothetical protein